MNKTINEAYSEYYSYISLRLKPTTLLHVNRIFNNHVLPILGNYKIREIDVNIYIKWVKSLQDLKYSSSFYNNIQSSIEGFFNYLSAIYKINNITKIVKLNNNSFKCKKNNLNTWTIKEFKKFINVIDEPIYHALFNNLFFTGMRKGEALALRFSDIEGNYLNINKNLTKELFNGKRLELTPKTQKSIRKIRIDYKLKNELNKLRKYYTTKYGYYNNDFFIFGGNKPLATTTIDRKRDKYCEIAKVKRIRIHDFRHSHATMLYNNHIDPKSIQVRLGHADISTTLNVYVHENQKKEKRLINMINLIRL